MPEQSTSNNGVPKKGTVSAEISGDRTASPPKPSTIASGAKPETSSGTSPKPGAPRPASPARPTNTQNATKSTSSDAPKIPGRFVASPPVETSVAADNAKPTPVPKTVESKAGGAISAKPAVAGKPADTAKPAPIAKANPKPQPSSPATGRSSQPVTSTPASVAEQATNTPKQSPTAKPGQVAPGEKIGSTPSAAIGKTQAKSSSTTGPKAATSTPVVASQPTTLGKGVSAVGSAPTAPASNKPVSNVGSAPTAAGDNIAVPKEGSAPSATANKKPVQKRDSGADKSANVGSTASTSAGNVPPGTTDTATNVGSVPVRPTAQKLGTEANHVADSTSKTPATDDADVVSPPTAAKSSPAQRREAASEPAQSEAATAGDSVTPSRQHGTSENKAHNAPEQTPVAAVAFEETEAATTPKSAKAPAGTTGSGVVAALTTVGFVLEVALLGAFGIWGLQTLNFSPVLSVLISVVPVLIFWILFLSPKAPLHFAQPYHAVVSHLLFAAGAVLLAVAGQPVLAIAMGVLTAISLALTVAARDRRSVPSKTSGRRAAR